MKKIISIKNSVDYAFDRITCFERPIINILNQQNSIYLINKIVIWAIVLYCFQRYIAFIFVICKRKQNLKY